MAKMQKSLDLNKLFSDQAEGKLLKKNINFPMYAGIKYDGNYCVIIKRAQGYITYITSGGHEYTHSKETIFDDPYVPIGMVYIAERIGGEGKLGDRDKCNLRGPRANQTSTDHTYKVHDCISTIDYNFDSSTDTYADRRLFGRSIFGDRWINDKLIHSQRDLDKYLREVVSHGYEGLMLKSPDWYWENTKSRKVTLVKYKKRPTADLVCVGVKEGTKKYEGMIGSLVLEDSNGRIVSVGSGLSDFERGLDSRCFVGKVIEIEFEQLTSTSYIQPTYITTRDDKEVEDID